MTPILCQFCRYLPALGAFERFAPAGGSPHRSQVVFQFILTVSLLAVGLYAVALRRRIPLLGNLGALVTMGALYLVWRPTDATALAAWLGIGRGVDMIFYCWVVISLVMILNLHLKIRIQTETLTELVRRLAIAQPFAVPPSAGGASRAGGKEAAAGDRPPTPVDSASQPDPHPDFNGR
jgi:hypothetical protein